MIFNRTAIGYSHLKSGKPCQDYSATYRDSERTIITACDGHGGDVYVRSDRGSKFASRALISVLGNMERRELRKLNTEPARNKLKLNILCEWNRLVEEDLACEPIRKKEIACLSDKDAHGLRMNQVKAYGSTMIGAMAFGNKIVTICIGDGGAFFIRKRGITPIFLEEDDEPVGNMTYSLCEEDAYDHIRVDVTELSKVEGVMLTSDGVINPYMNYANFEKSFAMQVVDALHEGRIGEVSKFIEDMGAIHGNGDDVTLSVMMRDRLQQKKDETKSKCKRPRKNVNKTNLDQKGTIADASPDAPSSTKNDKRTTKNNTRHSKDIEKILENFDMVVDGDLERAKKNNAILDDVKHIVESSSGTSHILDDFDNRIYMQDDEIEILNIFLGGIDNDGDSSGKKG